jgi:DNA-binding transcriptional ArsR family regulator
MSESTAPAAAPAGESSTEPLPERLISDVETLKALSDPLRIQILEVMVQDAGAAWTVKQIARAMGATPTKLYHHMRILEERDLIRPVSQQLVRGIVETTYRIAQLSLRLDRSLFAGAHDELRAGTSEAIGSIFELAHRDLDAAFAAGLVQLDPSPDSNHILLLDRAVLRLTPERAAELRDRLAALHAEFAADAEAPSSMAIGLLLAMHPIAGKGRPRRSA